MVKAEKIARPSKVVLQTISEIKVNNLVNKFSIGIQIEPNLDVLSVYAASTFLVVPAKVLLYSSTCFTITRVYLIRLL
jgi:hypothetical protein